MHDFALSELARLMCEERLRAAEQARRGRMVAAKPEQPMAEGTHRRFTFFRRPATRPREA